MEVGNSFLIECEAADALRTRQSLVAAARKWAQRHAPTRKFSVRSVDEGVRVWRTE